MHIRQLRSIRPGLWLVLLLVLGAMPVGRAQPPDDTSNAATWYRRAYERLDRIGLTPDQWTLLIEYEQVGGTPSTEVRDILQRTQPALADLQRAANQSYCDFGLDYSKGVNMEMPHLRGVRNLLRVAAADAAVRIADGDGAGAATQTSSLLRMVNHVSDDRVLMSSIISGAVFNIADGLIEAGYDAAAFSDAESAALLASMRSFDENDPFGAVDAMVGEQFMSIQTIQHAVAGGDQAAFDQFAAIYGLDDIQRGELAALTPEQLQAGLDAHSKLMDQYVAAFADGDHEAALAEVRRLDQACADGEYGLIATILRADFASTYGFLDRVRGMLHSRTDGLERIVGGDVNASDLANAAVWYRRGIEKLNALDDAWKRAIAQVDPSRPLDEQTIEALEVGAADAEIAAAEFVDGSKIRRCDFSRGRDEREVFVPLYADGMRDAFRLLVLESLRQEAKGDAASATHLLAAEFRMAAHLADDHLIVSSLVARDGCLLAARRGEPIVGRDPLVLDNIAEVSAAVRRVGVGDAFGFVGSAARAREVIRDRLLNWVPGKERAAVGARFDAWLTNVEIDELLYLLAMQDAMGYGFEPREPFSVQGVARLREYLLEETIQLATIDAPGFADRVKQRQPEAFEFPVTVHLARASERAATARRDLWDATRWARELKPVVESPREPER